MHSPAVIKCSLSKISIPSFTTKQTTTQRLVSEVDRAVLSRLAGSRSPTEPSPTRRLLDLHCATFRRDPVICEIYRQQRGARWRDLGHRFAVWFKDGQLWKISVTGPLRVAAGRTALRVINHTHTDRQYNTLSARGAVRFKSLSIEYYWQIKQLTRNRFM